MDTQPKSNPSSVSSSWRPTDPRHYQIAVLGALLCFGMFRLDFDIRPLHAGAILLTALASQWLLGRWVGMPRFEPRSALISSLSLCLLLRTDQVVLAMVAAAITIAGKFIIRYRGKHIFNPTNFGLALSMLLFDGVWVSSGQWGTEAWLAFLLAGFGMLVTFRAERSDVTWAFLFAWAGWIVGRASWLGDPLAIPLHQLQSGALLIFAFFMISDPKTTPNSRWGRILYACVVAGVAAWIQFGLYRPNALIWALVLCAPSVPVIDRVLPAARYRWQSLVPSTKTQQFAIHSPASAGLDVRELMSHSRR